MSYILVTGAAKNIGKAISLLLAKKGYDIAVHYKDSEDEALALQDEIRGYGVQSEVIYGDFSTKKGLDAFISLVKQKLKKVKGLVNNASVYKVGPLKDTSFFDLENLYQVNLFTPFYLINSFVKELIEQKGSIVNIGMCGLLTNMVDNYAPAYQMSKLSLLMLTKSLAKSLAKYKIRVNMVSPGYTETSVDLPQRGTNLPFGRAAKNVEIAEAVLFFMSHSYITGQNMEVAGGVRL